MARYVFEQVRYPASKALPCFRCSKPVRRSRTFMQTLNPFNVNAFGVPKTRSEIVVALRDEASAWLHESEECTPCLRARLR